MRIVLMGTSEFAVPTMMKIVQDGHTLVAAYTRAPAAGGRRGLELKKTPTHVAANGIGSFCLHAHNFAYRRSGGRL